MKKLVKRLSVVIFLGFAVSAYAQSPEGRNTVSRNYGRGETLYADRCQFCHGVTGDGKGPAASALNPRPTDFTDSIFWKYTSNEKIAKTIMSGHGRGMPAFTFSPEEIDAVIDSLSHFKKSGGK